MSLPFLLFQHHSLLQPAELASLLSVCAASVVRIVTLVRVDYNDPTWRLKDVFIWTAIEPGIGILSACLPTMRKCN